MHEFPVRTAGGLQDMQLRGPAASHDLHEVSQGVQIVPLKNNPYIQVMQAFSVHILQPF